jgi:hypothetical protein
MAQRALRVEKKDEQGRVHYVEFQIEARNQVTRLWNVFLGRRVETKKEKEGFQSNEDVQTYLKNQARFYAKQGYAPAGAPTPAPATQPGAASRGDNSDAAKTDDELSGETLS